MLWNRFFVLIFCLVLPFRAFCEDQKLYDDLLEKRLQLNKQLSEEEEIGAQKCICANADKEKIKAFNKDFIEKQTQRLTEEIKEFQAFHTSRIAELKAKIKKVSSDTTINEKEDWQLESIKLFIDQKQAALKRLKAYEKRLADLPNIKLHVGDLYKIVDLFDCIREGDVNSTMIFKKSMRSIELNENLENLAGQVKNPRNSIIDTALKKKLRIEEWNKQRCSFKENIDPEKSETEGSAITPYCYTCRFKSKLEAKALEAKAIAFNRLNCSDVVSCVDSPEEFLEAFKANKVVSKPNNPGPFSSSYSKPENQGVKIPDDATEAEKEKLKGAATSACVGFAIASDIEGILNKRAIEGTPLPPPDPWGLYSVMREQAPGKESEQCKGYVQGRDYSSKGIKVIDGINLLSKTPICLPGIDAQVHVKGAVVLTDTTQIDMSFFKKLVDHDQHPMVFLDSEWGEDREQWWQPVKGGVPHIAQVVGYGEAVNPATLKKESYVIMRDSIYNTPTHRWISFDDLKGSLKGVVKIDSSKLKIIETPIDDKK